MKLPRLPFQMMKRQFVGLGILGLIILMIYLGVNYFKNQKEKEPVVVEFVDGKTSTGITLSEFNPNDLSAQEWQKLGFSEKQTETILKYKDLVGGAFVSKEQLAKCYAISSEKFAEIEPFILLPDKKNETNKFSSNKKILRINGKFNPDHYTAKDWENLGYSQKQANAILKYKNYLGGSFRAKKNSENALL